MGFDASLVIVVWKLLKLTGASIALVFVFMIVYAILEYERLERKYHWYR